MSRFQLVFRDQDGERSEIRDSNTVGEPRIDGQHVMDGETYMIRGVEWTVRREDLDEMPRFVCSLVAGSVARDADGARSA